jgi:MarR family transcriptional regulator, organic hydroperoxide resistance regulator
MTKEATVTPTTHRDPARALEVISPLHKAMRQLEHHLGAKSRELGLRGSDAHLLAYVGMYGPCRMVELRRVFGHRPSTMTSLLDRLEARRWLTREPDPDDRRGYLVAATGEGKRTGRRARASAEDLEAAIRERVRARDLEGFHKVLKALGELTEFEPRASSKS